MLFSYVDDSVPVIQEFLSCLGLVDSVQAIDQRRPPTLSEIIHCQPFNIEKKEDELISIYAGRMPGISILGSGHYHHHTYGLCRATMDAYQIPYSVMMYDLHADSRCIQESIDCGNHLANLLSDSEYAMSAAVIGCDDMCQDESWLPRDVLDLAVSFYHYRKGDARFRDYRKAVVDCESQDKEGHDLSIRWHTVSNRGIGWITERAMSFCHDNIYVSVDLDVLQGRYARTDYGNGRMSLDELLESICQVREQKNIIGADIIGCGRKVKEYTLYSIAAILNELVDGPYERTYLIGKAEEAYEMSTIIGRIRRRVRERWPGFYSALKEIFEE